MRAVQIILGVILVGGLLATVWFIVTAPTTDVAPAKTAPVAATQAPLRTDIPPPDTMVFDNKYGTVTFNHKLHYDRVKGDCTVCHTKVFPQSREPLNYGKALH